MTLYIFINIWYCVIYTVWCCIYNILYDVMNVCDLNIWLNIWYKYSIYHIIYLVETIEINNIVIIYVWSNKYDII